MQVTPERSGFTGDVACTALALRFGDSPTLDPVVFGSLRGMLDSQVVAQIYREFLLQTRVRLSALSTLEDSGKLRELAHTLKGTAGMLGARELSAYAASLEDTHLAQSDLQQISRRMVVCCEELEEALRRERLAL